MEDPHAALLLSRQTAAGERLFGVSLEYLRDMLAASPALVARFGGGTALLARRKRAPRDLRHVAGLVGTKREDCGTCLSSA